MKKIKLTQGKYAIVDDEDFEYLNQWKWHYKKSEHGSGYAVRSQHKKIGFKKYKKNHFFMHRIINNTPETKFTDHINRDKLDNRKCNLKIVTKSQNGINRGKQKNNTSGYKGICWNKNAQKWMVEIKIRKKKIYLGIYSLIKDAVLVRKQAEKKYHATI